MAYSFPLTAAQFMQRLPIREISFSIPEAMEMAETGGGEVLTADLGTRLWQGEVFLADMTPDEATEVLPLLDILRRSGASFMAYDVSRPAPRSDLTGSILGSATPTLHSVSANTREIRIAGVPTTYQLRAHDYLAFSYGGRFALHRIVTGATAVAGLTPMMEVAPNIRAGWDPGAAITLIRASCKAIIVPGSVQEGKRKAAMTTGASFRFMQTLR